MNKSNNTPRVNVLLSAYNGEKYIGEQLESLLKQSYVNLHIYVRDDGSGDGTRAILERYAQNGKIEYTAGENLGFVNSFFELLKNSNDGDYYAFCDQDDVWLEDKIARAVKMLDAADGTKPALYAGSTVNCDAELNELSRDTQEKTPGFTNSMTECIAPGCTMVLNRAARDLIVSRLPDFCLYHDWWCYVVCQSLGTVVYDSEPRILFRRHGDNSTSDAGFMRLMAWRIKKYASGSYFENIRRQHSEFERLFGDELTERDRATLALFTRWDYSASLKKLFLRGRFRFGTADELMLRALFLLGIM